jgi:hypothetical protein
MFSDYVPSITVTDIDKEREIIKKPFLSPLSL